MIDWNNNGKHDSFDSFMEYQIYKDVMEDKGENDSYKSKPKNNYHKPKDKEEFEKYANTLSGLHLLLMLYLPIVAIVCFYFSKTTSSYRSLFFIITAVVHIIADIKMMSSPAFGKLKEGEEKRRELPSSVKVWILVSVVLFLIGLCIPRDNKKGTDDYSYSYSSSYHPLRHTTTKYDALSYDSSSTSYTTTSRKANTYSYTTKSYNKNKYYDEYNVYDYDDPEDFYEDNYDDFYDFEDAEDYFDEAWDE